MSENNTDPFIDALRDILTKAKEDRPKGAVPYGTPIICYSVSWCPPRDVSGTNRSVFSLSQPLITVEAEYDLIYVLFPPKNLESSFG